MDPLAPHIDRWVNALFSVFATAIALCLSGAVKSVDAQSKEAKEIVLEQLVSSAFVPQSVFVFRQGDGLPLKKLPAHFVDQGTGEGTDRKFLLGAPLNLVIGEPGRVNYTFFLKGSDAKFAATPVRDITKAELLEGSQSPDELKKEIEQFEASEEKIRLSLKDVQQELQALRRRASQVAGVDEIIDLKVELTRLKGFGEQTEAEQERLKRLIDLGRKRKDSAGIDERRSELTTQLQDTAQRTAMASRLTARKREAARLTVERKIALVQEMSAYNPEQIAREVLELRNRNRELEKQLGAGTEAATDF
ncbi:MAG: hypothetical protein IT290_09020 [Deltaproteobacteria bacterium]|nr:hypothetical protein [Deltaproteobacteria bacterium]